MPYRVNVWIHDDDDDVELVDEGQDFDTVEEIKEYLKKTADSLLEREEE